MSPVPCVRTKGGRHPSEPLNTPVARQGKHLLGSPGVISNSSHCSRCWDGMVRHLFSWSFQVYKRHVSWMKHVSDSENQWRVLKPGTMIPV